MCSREPDDFNLCLAVDMSGSVCNNGSGSECIDCDQSFLDDIISIFTQTGCRDNGVDVRTCCSNFASVKQFSSLMVGALEELRADKSFSVVQFATNAQLVSNLNPVQETTRVIENLLVYTGGLTNHQAAINMCQGTFRSFPGRKNFILLVTDGVPSEPFADPEGAAEVAADAAKAEGTHIIPVFIAATGNDLQALEFMRRLSSDGEVFDVYDFSTLNSLQDRLLDEVSCA